jgi:hypothetical protein
MASRRQTKAFRESLALAKIAKLPRASKTLPPKLAKMVQVRKALSDPLMDFVTRVPEGRTGCYKVLLHCQGDEEAQKIIDAWDELLMDRDASVKSTNIHDVCARAEISPLEFVGIVSRSFWASGFIAAKGVYAANYTRMMDASMKRAMQPDATDERAIHFKASGHLPTPKGIQIAMQQNNKVEREPEPGELPPVGRTARGIVRDLPPDRS